MRNTEAAMRGPETSTAATSTAIATSKTFTDSRLRTVNVVIDPMLLKIIVRDKFATNGWLLCEVKKYAHLHQNDVDMRLYSLYRANGAPLSLSEYVDDSIAADEVIYACVESIEIPTRYSIDEALPVNKFATRLSRFMVHLTAGNDSCQYRIPDNNMTCGWALSEATRKYMKRHDGEDPRALGLRIGGLDVDMGVDAVETVQDGSELEGVSYTLRPKANPPLKLPVRRISSDFQDRFSSLREVVDQVHTANPTIQSDVQHNRFRETNRPSGAEQFPLETVSDPTGLLPLYVSIVVDSVRLQLLERVSGESLAGWKYEDLHGWTTRRECLCVQVRDAWGIQEFVFNAGRPTAISKSLSSRVNLLVNNRKRYNAQIAIQRNWMRSLDIPLDIGEVQFQVERYIDPSGLFPQHVSMVFTASQVRIVDVVTQDTITSWPYIEVISWGTNQNVVAVALRDCAVFVFRLFRQQSVSIRKVFREFMSPIGLANEVLARSDRAETVHNNFIGKDFQLKTTESGRSNTARSTGGQVSAAHELKSC